MPATKNTPSTHHPRRRNVTTLMVGLKNGHIRKNLTQSGEPQRYSWGTQKKKKKKKNSPAPHDIFKTDDATWTRMFMEDLGLITQRRIKTRTIYLKINSCSLDFMKYKDPQSARWGMMMKKKKKKKNNNIKKQQQNKEQEQTKTQIQSISLTLQDFAKKGGNAGKQKQVRR